MKSGTILLGIGCGIRVACIRILASSKAFGNALQRMDSILDHFQMRKKAGGKQKPLRTLRRSG